MAEVQPLTALHYDLTRVGALGEVVAPPYDVIDAPMRAGLIGRSPFNVVELDLPEAPDDADPYEHAAETLEAWQAVEAATASEPWGEATDADGTVNRVWRIADPAVHAAVTEALAPAELLIADGHHRYETARVYADEIGGDGPHRYTLMALT